jgi:small subunit ribosomal protein S4|uniref:Ribosomal protein S4 n=1 Tax=Thecamonas trahens TaxID=529818 RepID=A0A0B5H4P3_THETB|nr:ribosomal protein S4 [Thecamonas trahens]AJF36634.1 ribosomal protein S4 [Thecamonas trahens]
MSFQPKYKICKQVGKNIWNKKHKIKPSKLVKAAKKRSSLYEKLFRQKKILRAYYGNLSNKQLQYILNFSKKNAVYKNNPLLFLEHRLDIIIYRLNWVNSVAQAKQFIQHGNILVNGVKITHRKYLIQPGDIIQVKASSIPQVVKRLNAVLDDVNRYGVLDYPAYFEVNYNVMSAIMLYTPNLEEIPFPIKLNPYTIKQLSKL